MYSAVGANHSTFTIDFGLEALLSLDVALTCSAPQLNTVHPHRSENGFVY